MDKQSAIVVKLPGTFNASGARRLKQELKQKLSNESPRVVVDLANVKQIDLGGLEALLTCMEEVARRDGALQLGEVSPEAATMLELTGMDELFKKFPAFAADVPTVTLSPESVPESVPTEAPVQLPVVA
jgi:anti-sigma B factor antagonist